MMPSSGAPSASPLTIRVVHQGATTACVSIRGRLDGSHQGRVDRALRALDLAAVRHVELDLAELESCDVDTAFELTAWAGDLRDGGVHVALVRSSPWVLTMLTLADVAGALTMPLSGTAAVLPQPAAQVAPDQSLALRWLLGVLDHDGNGSMHAQTARPIVAGEGESEAPTPTV